MACNIYIVHFALVRCYLNLTPVLVVLCASFYIFTTRAYFFGADAAAWAAGAAAWGIGVATWGAANKGWVTIRRWAVTISFRLIRAFSSPLARHAFSSTGRSMFANPSFLVRSGPIYTSRVLSCRTSALLRFSIIYFWSVVSHSIFMGRLFPRSLGLPNRVGCGVCLNPSVISSVSSICWIASRPFRSQVLLSLLEQFSFAPSTSPPALPP